MHIICIILPSDRNFPFPYLGYNLPESNTGIVDVSCEHTQREEGAIDVNNIWVPEIGFHFRSKKEIDVRNANFNMGVKGNIFSSNDLSFH